MAAKDETSDSGAYHRRWAGRALRGLGVAVLAGVAVGGLAAPHLYNGLVRLGRLRDEWGGLRELGFVSVAGRCVLMATLLFVLVFFRQGRFGTAGELGLGRRGGGSSFVRWAGLGLLTMAGLYAAGLAAGAYRPAGPEPADIAGSLAAAAATGLVVGWIEDTLFRGILYGASRVYLGAGVAAFATSLVFSLVHFAEPVPWVSVAHADWNDGLALLGSLFRFVHARSMYLPYGATLFVMGIVLCRVYEWTGRLAACVGLHAGWVAGLFGLRVFVIREPLVCAGFFGAGDNPAHGWGALALMAVFLAALAVPRRPSHARPAARAS